ncbi:YeeE/YedE thiosulfate transporter family protein [Acinetobacter baumannii]
MLLGARIADGCTTGHGLSGIAQLAVGSTVAVAAMFTGGIATALLVLRRI